MVYFDDKRLNSINLTYDNFYVVMDFDNTITTPDKGTNSWSILENPNFMNPKLHEVSHKLFKIYYPFELDYNLDYDTKSNYMQEWYSKNINLFYEYGLTYDIFLTCVNHADFSFRNGFKDFLNVLSKHHIPVIVLSAGIGNVIYELFKLNDLLYDNLHIISNFIKFDKTGAMLPFNDVIIHSCNKCLDTLPINFRNDISRKEHALLFGDLIEDLNMLSKDELKNSLSFGFLENEVENNFELYKEHFDVVLTDNSSFYDVRNVLNNVIKDN